MKWRIALTALGVVAAVAAVETPTAPGVQAARVTQRQLRIPAEFQHTSEFVRLLERSGVSVQEVLPSMMGAMFEGEDSAALVRTALGVVEIVVLPGTMEAEQISVTYTRNASTVVPHHYVLKGPRLLSEGQTTTDAAYPLYFTLHRNWFIMTLEPRLDDIVKHALKQTNRPLR